MGAGGSSPTCQPCCQLIDLYYKYSQIGHFNYVTLENRYEKKNFHCNQQTLNFVKSKFQCLFFFYPKSFPNCQQCFVLFSQFFKWKKTHITQFMSWFIKMFRYWFVNFLICYIRAMTIESFIDWLRCLTHIFYVWTFFASNRVNNTL